MNRDKILGMMLGVAISDQLGMPVETYTQEKIQERHGRITDYIDPDPDHKWFGGMKSRWTDDTQLTLVVAESLIAKKCIDMDDMAKRHVKSYQEEGDFGWGKSTRESVKRLTSGIHWSRSGEIKGYGNGVAMKVAPVGIYFSNELDKLPSYKMKLEVLEQFVAWFSQMTHNSLLGIESALAQVSAIDYCLYLERIALLDRYSFLSKVCYASTAGKRFIQSVVSQDSIADRLEILMFNWKTNAELSVADKVKMFGGANSYVYNSLPFCYAMFLENPTSIETLYNTVNAGGDTDTNGSIVGSLLGALNGTKIFPQHLINGLWQKDRILDTADRLCDAFGIKN